MNTIHIAFSINRPYILICAITMLSILRSANNNTYFNFYIVHNNNISKSDVEILKSQKAFARFNNFSIIPIDCSKHIEELSVNNIGNWGQEVNFKVFFPLLFPYLNKILSLDVDLIVKNDLNHLWSLNIDNVIFVASIKNTQNDINAGALLINLDLARKMNATYEISKMLQSQIITEENAISFLYKNDKILFVNDNYIFHSHTHKKNHYNSKLIYNDIIIHHYSGSKPYYIEKAKLQFNRESLNEYWTLLEYFIDNKYKIQFKFLKLYSLSIATTIHSTIRRIIHLITRLTKKQFNLKIHYIFKLIHKCSTLHQELQAVNKKI